MRPSGPLTRASALGRAECEPWLTLIGLAFGPAVERDFGRMVPAGPPRVTDDGAPLLAGATIVVDAPAARRYVNGLLATAAATAGVPGPVALGEDATLALVAAAVSQDSAAIGQVAAHGGLDVGLLLAVSPLAVIPLLQAYRRAWSSHVSPQWARPFCPVCGAWPGLAEVRGLDRSRRFRCLRCAADWRSEWLACPYCDNRRHTELGALVSAYSPETRRAETCSRCRGYLKSITTLQASPADRLGMLDVETIELDIAAVERGYHRPNGPGHPLGTRLEGARRRRALFWTR